MKFIVKGYQSLIDLEIEVNAGELVSIEGDNNVGKSAFVRAIESFILNFSSKDDINYFSKVATVSIVDDNNDIYSWIKDQYSSKYEKNTYEIDRLARSKVNVVFPELGFRAEKEGTEIFVPQIANEGTVLFPFNVSPSISYKIFSKFISAPKINDIILELKELVRTENKLLEVTNVRIDTYKSELSDSLISLQTLPSEDVLLKLRSRYEKIQEVKAKVQIAESYKKINFSLQMVQERKLLLKKTLSLLPESIFQVLNSQFVELNEMKRVYSNLSLLKIQYLDLKDKINNLKSLSKSKQRLDKIGQGLIKLVKAKKGLDDLEKVTLALTSKVSEKKVIHEELSKFSFCPFCRRPFD